MLLRSNRLTLSVFGQYSPPFAGVRIFPGCKNSLELEPFGDDLFQLYTQIFHFLSVPFQTIANIILELKSFPRNDLGGIDNRVRVGIFRKAHPSPIHGNGGRDERG